MKMSQAIDRDGSDTAAIETALGKNAQESKNAARTNRDILAGRRHNRLKWIVAAHTLAGVVLGILLLHPVTMVIYCFEFHPELAQPDVLHFVASRMANAFTPEMWPMTGSFAFIGALLGIGSGLYSRSNTQKLLLVSHLDRRLGKAIRSLISAGESAAVEFKSSLRWDHVQSKCNKALEIVIAKTIAGFLNHEGGDLLIGVADDGAVVGLKDDYATLRKKDRDGFELLLMKLVKDKLGGDVCTLLNVVFQEIDDCDVCRVMIERSERPVYVDHDGRARYFVRTGNSTPELDTKEALDHVARRQSRT